MISLWEQADVQNQLDGVTRNRRIYEQIVRDLDDLGWEWTWEECRTKMKNLTQRYWKVRALKALVGMVPQPVLSGGSSNINVGEWHISFRTVLTLCAVETLTVAMCF